MKAQLSLISAHISSNPNTLKIVSVAIAVALSAIGLLAPAGVAVAGPISGPVDVF